MSSNDSIAKERVPIAAVTGTKGKTTTVAIISDVLLALKKNVLKVDTTGHFVNGERRSTLEDSKRIWRLVPSVAPGRYLWEFFAHPELTQDGFAVLEAALGSSSIKGLGYNNHKVGVFLNVYEDHLGSSARLKEKIDIANAKAFVFSKLFHTDSYAVFNADDELVVKMLERIPSSAKGASLVPFGINFAHFDIKAHLASGGVAVTTKGNQVVILSGDDEKVVADLTKLPWTFDGQFEPSVWNILASVGAIYGLIDGNWSDEVSAALESVRLDPNAGRLTVFKNDNNIKIIADYAHEKVSLELMGKLAHSQVGEGGKVIGVVRLAYDRTDELLAETSEIIARSYDTVVIYDKIDGHFRQAKHTSNFPQVVGRTSQVMYDAAVKVNEQTTRVIREDEAIEYAASIAQPGDVVVVIVNDDIERSLGFIKQAFKAELI